MDTLTIDNISCHPYPRDAVIPERLFLNLITTEDHLFTGEACFPSGTGDDSFRKARHQLKCLAEDWKGKKIPLNPVLLKTQLEKDIERDLYLPAVLFAFDSTCYQAAARAKGISIAQFISQRLPAAIYSACTINGPMDTIRRQTAAWAADGYKTFDIPVGSRNIPLDVQKVDAIRSLIPMDARIRLYGGGCWSLNEASAFASAIGKDRIELISAPCTDEQINGAFFKRTDIPWAIDAARSKSTLASIEGALGVKAVIATPSLSGGITGTLDILVEAENTGLSVIIRAAGESIPGLTILANLAALTRIPLALGETFDINSPLHDHPDPACLIGKGGLIPPGLLQLNNAILFT